MGTSSFVRTACLGLLVAATACAGASPVNGDDTGGGKGDDPCEASEYACSDGECIPRAQICNGYANCADGRDERNCTPGCRNDQYQCGDGSCIARTQVCDGASDCTARDDEANCGGAGGGCAASEFTCMDGSCIPSARKCDGAVDCIVGGNDERGCGPATCGATQFRCQNGSCIDSSRLCNGSFDCPMHEDELSCSGGGGGSDPGRGGSGGSDGSGGVCDALGLYTCPGIIPYCIPQSWKCDGTWDCLGGSDEAGCPGGSGGSGGTGGSGGGTPTCGGACGGISYVGTCSGAELRWCEGGTLYCATCGDGTTCTFNSGAGYNDCVDSGGGGGTPACGGACGGIGYAGECSGGQVRWCEGGVLQCETCGTGETCGYSSADSYYACLASGGGGGGGTPTCGGGCGSIGYVGECSGDTVRWCEGGVLQCESCGTDTCGYSSSDGYYACLASGGGGGGGGTATCGGACGGVGYVGECSGNTVRWCEGGVLQCESCGTDTCGYSSSDGYYACLASGGGGGGGGGGSCSGYLCDDGVTCISSSWVCDGEYDCPDWDDEYGCSI